MTEMVMTAMDDDDDDDDAVDFVDFCGFRGFLLSWAHGPLGPHPEGARKNYFSNIWWVGTWRSKSTASWAMCVFSSFAFGISGYSAVAPGNPVSYCPEAQKDPVRLPHS